MKNNTYTFRNLLLDILNVRENGVKDKYGRWIWGSNPHDLGEGLAFSYSGDTLIQPGNANEGNIGTANIELELKLINDAINKALKINIFEEGKL